MAVRVVVGVALLAAVHSKPTSTISPVGLEDFYLNNACEEACSSQWHQTELIKFSTKNDCISQLCTPILDHRSNVEVEVAEPSLPDLDDFVLNCPLKCEAEWWLDGLHFESMEHCAQITCSFLKQPQHVKVSKEEEQVVAVVEEIVQVSAQESMCYRHGDCDDDEYCGKGNKCLALRDCSHTDTATDPIDGLCPQSQRAKPTVPSRISQVIVSAGHYVDEIRIVLFNGTERSFGAQGGTEQKPFDIPDGEWLTWIKVWQGSYLDGIQFFTNKGTASPKYGGEGGRKLIFHVDKGREIAGLVRDEEGIASPIQNIVEQDRPKLQKMAPSYR